MKAIVYKDETMGADYELEEIPADMQAEAQEYREKLIEKVSESDDQLLEKYLSGEAITEAEITRALRARTIASVRDDKQPTFVPVICGSAFKNKGVQPLLDAVVDFLPSPLDIPPVEGLDPRSKEGRDDPAPGRRRRAVCRACLQDHDRPVRRSAHVLPRLLRRAAIGVVGRRMRRRARPSASAAC